MENKRHGKSLAREAAIKSIYTYTMTGNEVNIYSSDKLGNAMTKNTLVHLDEIDDKIKKYLRKWSMTELNKVNLAILRIAVYEILFEDTPNQIVVNEALEFTKLYSDVAAKNFVHSVLDNIIKE
jgi:N utilization substance protein B